MNRILATSLALNLALVSLGSYCLHRKGGLAYLSRVLNPPAVRGHYQDTKQSVYRSLPVNAGDTLVVGDSLADYGEWSELMGPTWRNRGINGATTVEVWESLYHLPPAMTALPKRIVFIVGVNDIQAGIPIAETRRFFEAHEKYTGPIELYFVPVMAANHAKYQAWIRPDHPDNIEPTPERVRAVNKFIPDDMKIDVSPLLQPDGQLRAEFTNDGLHLNGPGYRVLAGQIKQRISL